MCFEKRIYIVRKKGHSHENADSQLYCRLPIKYKMTTMDVSSKSHSERSPVDVLRMGFLADLVC